MRQEFSKPEFLKVTSVMEAPEDILKKGKKLI